MQGLMLVVTDGYLARVPPDTPKPILESVKPLEPQEQKALEKFGIEALAVEL